MEPQLAISDICTKVEQTNSTWMNRNDGVGASLHYTQPQHAKYDTHNGGNLSVDKKKNWAM